MSFAEEEDLYNQFVQDEKENEEKALQEETRNNREPDVSKQMISVKSRCEELSKMTSFELNNKANHLYIELQIQTLVGLELEVEKQEQRNKNMEKKRDNEIRRRNLYELEEKATIERTNAIEFRIQKDKMEGKCLKLFIEEYKNYKASLEAFIKDQQEIMSTSKSSSSTPTPPLPPPTPPSSIFPSHENFDRYSSYGQQQQRQGGGPRRYTNFNNRGDCDRERTYSPSRRSRSPTRRSKSPLRRSRSPLPPIRRRSRSPPLPYPRIDVHNDERRDNNGPIKTISRGGGTTTIYNQPSSYRTNANDDSSSSSNNFESHEYREHKRKTMENGYGSGSNHQDVSSNKTRRIQSTDDTSTTRKVLYSTDKGRSDYNNNNEEDEKADEENDMPERKLKPFVKKSINETTKGGNSTSSSSLDNKKSLTKAVVSTSNKGSGNTTNTTTTTTTKPVNKSVNRNNQLQVVRRNSDEYDQETIYGSITFEPQEGDEYDALLNDHTVSNHRGGGR